MQQVICTAVFRREAAIFFFALRFFCTVFFFALEFFCTWVFALHFFFALGFFALGFCTFFTLLINFALHLPLGIHVSQHVLNGNFTKFRCLWQYGVYTNGNTVLVSQAAIF